MFDKEEPDGEPVMYMLSTRKIVGQYVTTDVHLRGEDYDSVKAVAPHFASTGRIPTGG